LRAQGVDSAAVTQDQHCNQEKSLKTTFRRLIDQECCLLTVVVDVVRFNAVRAVIRVAASSVRAVVTRKGIET
jgi:hypothetical protein